MLQSPSPRNELPCSLVQPEKPASRESRRAKDSSVPKSHFSYLLPCSLWGPAADSSTRYCVTLSTYVRNTRRRASFQTFPTQGLSAKAHQRKWKLTAAPGPAGWGLLEPHCSEITPPHTLNKGLLLEWEPQETQFLKTECFWLAFLQAPTWLCGIMGLLACAVTKYVPTASLY